MIRNTAMGLNFKTILSEILVIQNNFCFGTKLHKKEHLKHKK